MTSHELAKRLLAHNDIPVQLVIGTPESAVSSDLEDSTLHIVETDVDVETMQARGFENIKQGRCIQIRGWESSEEA